MSSISSTSFRSPLDLLTRPSPLDPQKQSTSHKSSPLSANTNEASRNATNTSSKLSTLGAFKLDANEADPVAKARAAAEGLVSTTFIEPILKQVRESNDTPPPFGPSSAEKQFASLLDTKLADEIVHAANFPLVERISKQLLANMPAPSAADYQPIDLRA